MAGKVCSAVSWSIGKENGGGKGIRTPGLTDANRTLYQLSYTPTGETEYNTAPLALQCSHS